MEADIRAVDPGDPNGNPVAGALPPVPGWSSIPGWRNPAEYYLSNPRALLVADVWDFVCANLPVLWLALAEEDKGGLGLGCDPDLPFNRGAVCFVHYSGCIPVRNGIGSAGDRLAGGINELGFTEIRPCPPLEVWRESVHPGSSVDHWLFIPSGNPSSRGAL